MKTKLTVLCLFILCSGAYAAEKVSRVNTTLKAMEFNSVASQYMEKPTFVEMVTWGKNEPFLAVRMTSYKTNSVTGKNEFTLVFNKPNVAEYVNAIDKYFEWESLATSRKEAFTKEIARIKGKGPTGGSAKLAFIFHSANEGSHYLEVVATAVGMIVADTAQLYDRQNASALKALLLSFEADTLPKPDIDSIYK